MIFQCQDKTTQLLYISISSHNSDDKHLYRSTVDWNLNTPPARLWNTIVPSLEDAKGALVAHLDQHTQGQLQHHPALVGHKVSHILQQEESRAVVITEGEVRGHKGVL